MHKEYYHPRFFTTPTSYNLKQKSAYLFPALGNTVAVALNPFSANIEQVRIAFQYYDVVEGSWGALDAVYCKDLYAEQLESELNGKGKTTFFTDSFGDYYPFGEEDDGVAWICPRASENLDITYSYPLRAEVIPCQDALFASYA